MTNKFQEDLARRLGDSIAGLQREAAKVEFWASAMAGCAQPVPAYEPEHTKVGRYVRPGRRAKKKKLHRRGTKRRADGARPHTRIGMST